MRSFTYADVKCPKFKTVVHISYHHAMINGEDRIIHAHCPIREGEHSRYRCNGFENNSPPIPCYILSTDIVSSDRQSHAKSTIASVTFEGAR